MFDVATYRMWATVTKNEGPDHGIVRLGCATSPNRLDRTKQPYPVLVGSEPRKSLRLHFPAIVLFDHFETGDTAIWSSVVPWATAHVGVSPFTGNGSGRVRSWR